jgi:hypothetical protein
MSVVCQSIQAETFSYVQGKLHFMKFFEVQRARGHSAAVHVGASGPECCQSYQPSLRFSICSLSQSSADSVATLVARLMDRVEALLLQFLLDHD